MELVFPARVRADSGHTAGRPAKRGLKRCQSDVAGDSLVSPVLPQILQEGKDEIRVYVIEVERCHRMFSFADQETEQQGKRVWVAPDQGLFGCQPKMVASDSTFARVARWLEGEHVQRFLLSFRPTLEERDLLRKSLGVAGKL